MTANKTKSTAMIFFVMRRDQNGLPHATPVNPDVVNDIRSIIGDDSILDIKEDHIRFSTEGFYQSMQKIAGVQGLSHVFQA